MSSPTQRSLALLRSRGYIVDVVERIVPKTYIRKDLFGCLDLLGVTEDGRVIGVQTTTDNGGAVAARVRKVRESEAFDAMRAAGWELVCHGWRKVKNRWQVREVDVS